MDEVPLIARPAPLKGRGQRFFAFAGAVAFAILFLSTLLSVVARFFALSHFEWTFEVAAIAFVWVTFLGIVVGEIRGENVSFDPVKDWFRPSIRRAIDGAIAICVAVLGLVLLWSGWAVWQRFVPTPVLRLPQGVSIASILVLGSALAGLGVARFRRVVLGRDPYPEREHAG